MIPSPSSSETAWAPPALDAVARLVRASHARGWRASIHLSLPAARGFDDLASVRRRYDGLCERAAERLAELGAPEGESRRLVQALRSIPVEPHRCPAEARAIAVLAADDRAGAFALAASAQDEVAAGGTLRLRPILADLHANVRYRVLALADHRVELFEGDRWELAPVAAPGVPRDLRSVVGDEIARNAHTLQHHTTAARGEAAVFHGHGGANRGREVDRERFHRAVAREVHRTWSTRRDPLVLAADRSHQGLFRHAADLPGLLAEGLSGSPERMDAADLRRHAWPIVERHRAARDAEVLDGLEGRLAHGRAVAGVRPVLRSALSSQVQRLWLDRDARSPGGVDPATGALRRPAGDEDALDAIAGLVLERGGEVVPVPAGALPGGEPVAADLRGGRPPSTG